MIRIITINTWKCDGQYKLRLQALANGLKELKPDLVALQEVFYAPGAHADTLGYLADTLQMPYSFAPARYKVRNFDGKPSKSYSGLGIISSLPILQTDALALPEHPADGQRIAMRAIIDLPENKLNLVNTHLTHLRGQEELREAQLKCILDEWYANPKEVFWICGDFNATPGAEAMGLLYQAGLNDVFAVNRKVEGRTFSYPATIGTSSIDHIFVSAQENSYPKVQNARIVLNQPDPKLGVFPSDHFGVLADILI